MTDPCVPRPGAAGLPRSRSVRFDPMARTESAKSFPVRCAAAISAPSVEASAWLSPASCPAKSATKAGTRGSPSQSANRGCASTRPSARTTSGSAGADCSRVASRSASSVACTARLRIRRPVKTAHAAAQSQIARITPAIVACDVVSVIMRKSDRSFPRPYEHSGAD